MVGQDQKVNGDATGGQYGVANRVKRTVLGRGPRSEAGRPSGQRVCSIRHPATHGFAEARADIMLSSGTEPSVSAAMAAAAERSVARTIFLLGNQSSNRTRSAAIDGEE
jgi:hypothetical protein